MTAKQASLHSQHMAGSGGNSAGGRFPTTRLSLLEKARGGAESERREAFGVIAGAYWRPVYTYVRIHWRLDPHDAEDCTQTFLATAWSKGFFDRYDPVKARFRTFLRSCVDGVVQNERKSANAAKRGGGVHFLSLDFESAEDQLLSSELANGGSPEELFQHEYVRSLFSNAVQLLKSELDARGRNAVFAVFDRYDLGPSDGAGYSDVAQELGLTVAQVTNHLHSARRRFREIMLEQLRELSGSEEEFRQEVREILGIELQ